MEEIKTKLQIIREKEAYLRREVTEKITGYILAALGLVAGLAWNEAIKAVIDSIFPATGKDIIAKFIYAVIVTVIIVIVSIYLLRLNQKKEEVKS